LKPLWLYVEAMKYLVHIWVKQINIFFISPQLKWPDDYCQDYIIDREVTPQMLIFVAKMLQDAVRFSIIVLAISMWVKCWIV
jgi:hypothetical protein